MIELVSFDVRGRPVPQGTLVRNPAGGVFHKGGSNGPLQAWRTDIRSAAAAAMPDQAPVAGPVRVDLVFRLARPAAHFLPANRRRERPELRLDAPAYPTSAPDADKLARAALDALTSVVFADDAQVAGLVVTKRYVDEAEGPGVRVTVRRLEETR